MRKSIKFVRPAKRARAHPPQKLQRPGADEARHMVQKVKPVPLPGKSRGR